ncbi:hypothetical protein [Algoriphagus persicinus]|uniref:hypothetical protein n=1 Tax=Algoriphagus persicinus TaxID=3108754 RepID=UPI002B3EADFB|nr:hypothetical protein [Algoriphagus sp. E1-3-M2]MEB2786301.1 hypothetical protein [Algoriphagus sp. E1-3-M2]
MLDFIRLKILQVEKEELISAITEKERIRQKSMIFLGIFVLAILIMVPLQESFTNSAITETEFKAGKTILKFGGMFFWAGIFLLFRIYSLNKQIKALKKEYRESIKEARYLSN